MKLLIRMGLLTLLVIAMSSLAEAQPTRVPSLKGRVKGKVYTLIEDDLVLPISAIVSVTGNNFNQQTRTDSEGNYEFEIPAGVYRITAETHSHYPFRRAAFRVQPNTTLTIDIVPVPKIRTIGTAIAKDGRRYEPTTLAPPPMYERFTSRCSTKNPCELVISFSEKQRRRGVIEYTFAVASYNTLTVYADVLRFDPKRFRLSAEGAIGHDVVVEDGKQQSQFKRVDIELKTGEPIIKGIEQ